MLSDSKVHELFLTPVVSAVALDAIKEIDPETVLSNTIDQADRKAATFMVRSWMSGWGDDDSALDRFADLMTVSETDFGRASADLTRCFTAQTGDTKPTCLAIRIIENWLDDATHESGTNFENFVVLAYLLTMTTPGAPLLRKELLKTFKTRRSRWSVVFVVAVTAFGLALLHHATMVCVAAGLLLVPIFEGLRQSLDLVATAEREWNKI